VKELKVEKLETAVYRVVAVAWNPVKELKVEHRSDLRDQALREWNPVKELKVYKDLISFFGVGPGGIR